MFKKLWGRVRDTFKPDEKGFKYFKPKAHPSEQLVNPESYIGHGSISARYRYMTLGPNRHERRRIAAEIVKFKKHGTPKGVDPQKYHAHIKMQKWILANTPKNIPARNFRDDTGVMIPNSYRSNNPLFGRA